MMKHGWLLAAAAVLTLGVGLVVGTTRHPPAQAAVAAEAKSDAAKKLVAQRVEICEALLKSVDDREHNGFQPISPEYVRYKGNLLRRLADAELAAAAGDRAARAKAAEAYVGRGKALLRTVEERFKAGADVNDTQVQEARYTVNDAELLVEEVKGEK